MIHETAIIEDGASVGKDTTIWHLCHVREGAKIGTGCSLGRNCYVDTGVVVGNGCRFQNNVSIYKGCIVHDNVFIGPHVTFTNDLYPRAFNRKWKAEKTLIEAGVSIGANSTILCGIRIGQYAMIAAGTTVTTDVPPYALVQGPKGEIVGKVSEDGKPA